MHGSSFKNSEEALRSIERSQGACLGDFWVFLIFTLRYSNVLFKKLDDGFFVAMAAIGSKAVEKK